MLLPALTSSIRMKFSRMKFSELFDSPVTRSLTTTLMRCKGFWHSLNFAQRCYLLATLLFLLEAAMVTDRVNWFTGALTLLVLGGLASEFWPRFLHVWHSLPGKALILLFYAVVANFALGNAAGMVNDITGVSAASLPYSHNFAILLSLPGWFFMTSLLVLLLIQVAMPFYLLLLLLLKPFGLHGLWHPPHYRFVFTTALVRYVWSFALLIQLLMLGAATGIAADAGAFGRGVYDEILAELEEESGNKDKLKQADSAPGDAEATAELMQDTQGNFGIHITSGEKTTSVVSMPVKDMQNRADRYHSLQQSALALFIFEFEADGRSRCEHLEGSRVVELNDYEILEILPDQSQPQGYSYQVRSCISAAFGKRTGRTTDNR
ncbi:hypothetical protein [Shewanella sedimentimangrovi]|uniref:Uncharacterized protein n=1 Tax=Shewanella sedimentimangrovi TaxID=2814293 RepID=A0ABX7R554_9GAMM|nr:hypothetical protein [Shewanella sedimentimangrovi]QSX37958.1 hypothetical protein JYB85_03710 [Shewanella sedimentimangrovi]